MKKSIFDHVMDRMPKRKKYTPRTLFLRERDFERPEFYAEMLAHLDLPPDSRKFILVVTNAVSGQQFSDHELKRLTGEEL